MSSINNFEFVLPTKIIFGEGTIEQLPDAVKNMGHEKPLIVTDKGLIAAGLVSKITDVLDDAGIEYAIFAFHGKYGFDLASAPSYHAMVESVIVVAVICGMAIVRHHANIVRLLHHEENKLGAKKAVS